MFGLLLLLDVVLLIYGLVTSMLHTAALIILAVLLLPLLWFWASEPRVSNKPDFTALKNWFYAHRGYHTQDQSIPENSLAAFGLAVENGFGIELDVHLTKDGRLAVFHDDSLSRMCGTDVGIEDLDSDEVKKFRLKGTNEQIPFFSEVLQMVDSKIPMIIEVKTHGGNSSALCERLCKELEEYNGAYCVESFDPRAIRWFKKFFPSVVRGQLAMAMHRYGKRKIFGFLLSNCLLNFMTKPDFIAYCHDDRKNLGLRFCKQFYGVQEFSWTVRTPDVARKLQKSGALLIFEYFDPRKL